MENGDREQTNMAPLRGRPTSKLKVLGRSHAMREEQSPPRAPSSTPSSSSTSLPECCLSEKFQKSSTNIGNGNGGGAASAIAIAAGGHLQSPPTLVLSPSPAEEEEEHCAERENGGGSGGAGGNNGGNESPPTLVATPNTRCSPYCETNGTFDPLYPIEADLPPSPKYHNISKNGTSIDGLQNNKSNQVSPISKVYCSCQNQNCIKCLKDKGGIHNNCNSTNNNNNNNNTSNNNSNNNNGSPNMLYVNKTKGKLKQQSSSQTSLSFESSAANSPILSRDSSTECYTDSTGINLEEFIRDTMNRSAKDRDDMLKIEKQLIAFAENKEQSHYKFRSMSSYHRMLVHRCAAHFGMDHNIDQAGNSVVVNKTENTRIPDVRFKDYEKELFTDEPPRRSILKRDSNSTDCCPHKGRAYSLENRRSKSYEERKEEYEKTKNKIFEPKMHASSMESYGSLEMPWPNSIDDNHYPRYKLQPPDSRNKQLKRLLKVHSEEAEQSIRPCVAKSYSFGGYGGSVSILTRGDSVVSTHSAPGSRLLTKQDSGASSVSWRLSPSSSGYKSQSQISESVTPSPTSTPYPQSTSCRDAQYINDGYEQYHHYHHHHHHDHHQHSQQQQHHHHHKSCVKSGNPVVWAVTDMCNVPKGSIIINPETGEPYKNQDGSIYHYDSNRPPPGLLPSFVARLPENDDRPNIIESPPPKEEKSPPMLSPPIQQEQQQQQQQQIQQQPHYEKSCTSLKASPVKTKSNLINSATSPSLPFSPPPSSSGSGLSTTRNYPYLQAVNSCENIQNLNPPQYAASYTNQPATAEPTPPTAPMYHQQPYIVYTTPYSVPYQQQSPYGDGRLDQSTISELSGPYFVPEGSVPQPAAAAAAATASTITFPTQSSGLIWNQNPLGYYSNGSQCAQSQTPPQRYSMQMAQQNQTTYMNNGYPTAINYIAQTTPQAPQQHPDIVPLYPNQPIQVLYPGTATQQNTGTLLYQNPSSLIYSQPYYQTSAYTTPTVPMYPQSTTTPSSCSSIPTTPFGADGRSADSFIQLAQNMQQMQLNSTPTSSANNNNSNNNPRGYMPVNFKCPQFDPRRNSLPKLSTNSLNSSKPPHPTPPTVAPVPPPAAVTTTTRQQFAMGSSQSSTGTNSPAATVISAGYCQSTHNNSNNNNVSNNNGTIAQYRTQTSPPPSTPPTPQIVYHPQTGGFSVAPQIFRQISSERQMPSTTKSSRSPTPANDFDRQRFILSPNLYQGMSMPYFIHTDPRLVGRGQPTIYRHAAPFIRNNKPLNTNYHATDNRSHNNNNRSRRSKYYTREQ